MLIDFADFYNDSIALLEKWRRRYSQTEYPSKIVMNIFYSQYGMNMIWESQIASSFGQLTNSEKDIAKAFNQIFGDYRNAQEDLLHGEILNSLMEKNKDSLIGNLRYGEFKTDIKNAENGDNSAVERLEYNYIQYRLINTSILFWAGFGRLGTNKLNSLAKITGGLDPSWESLTFDYSTIFQALTIPVAFDGNKLYSPLPLFWTSNEQPSAINANEDINNVSFYAYSKKAFQSGLEKFDKNDKIGAIEDFTKAIELNHLFSEAYFNRGWTFLFLPDYKKAIEDFDKVILLKSQLSEDRIADVFKYRGSAKLLLAKYEDAFSDFNQAIKHKEDFSNAYYQRGIANTFLNRFSEAVEDFSKTIDLLSGFTDSEKEVVYVRRGDAKEYKEDYSGAIQDFTSAIELNQYYTEAHYKRGVVYGKQGSWINGIKDFDKVILIDRELGQAYINRGIFKLNSGDKKNAEIDILKAIDLGVHEAKDILKQYF